MNNLKLALLFTKINSNRILSDPTETLYYGSRITNPDQGIHYTFLKSPNGDIGLLRTENTDKVLEDISNLIEVCVEEEKTNPIKLTFLLKWNEADYVTTWGDTITKEFLVDFDKNLQNYKLTVPTYLIDGQKRYMSPFLNDDSIALSFKVTEGRDLLYLKEAIPELFRRIYSEELTSLDNISSLLKDTFLEIDWLKANDSRQDNDVIKTAVVALRSQAIRKNIEEWLNEYNSYFQTKYHKYQLDLQNYSTSTRCYILLESRNVNDEPIINSEIKTVNGLMYVKHSIKGYPIESQIRYATQNKLEVAEQISDHTFIAYGGQQLNIYSSTPNLSMRIVRIAQLSPAMYMEKRDTLIHEYISNKELIFQRNGRYYTFSISGTPPKESEVGKLKDYIWRMATKSGWGAGWGISNTEALKQNRDIRDACNTRSIIPLSITIDELKTYETLNVYIDDWYAVASGGGNGGIHYYTDYTGRMCYQGYAVYANNEASIPTSKLNIPLIMDNIGQAQSAHLKINIDLKTFKWDGSWNRIYNAPTGLHGLSVSQTRRKGRLLGGYNFRYYLRVINNSQLELLCEYQQNADGDSGDNCYTQGAARIGVYLYGKKPNSLKINIIDYFTKEVVYSYPATNVKTTTPSMQIVDIENSYYAYLALGNDKTNGFNIHDTNTNQIYYAKEVLNVYSSIKYNEVLELKSAEYDISSLSSKNIENSKFNVKCSLSIGYPNQINVDKSDDNTLLSDNNSIILFNPADDGYYILENDTYKEIDYNDYLSENMINTEIIKAPQDLINNIKTINEVVMPNRLAVPKIYTQEVNIPIADTIDKLNQNIEEFTIAFENDDIKSINVNNLFVIYLILKENKLLVVYKSLKENQSLLVDFSYQIIY